MGRFVMLNEHANSTDTVNHPAHYNQFPVEVIELTKWLNFCRGNAVKYLTRAGTKSAEKEIEDLEKAIWYIQTEIDRIKYVREQAKLAKQKEMDHGTW